MSDRYQSLIHTPVGQLLAKNLGLPNPVRLERYTEGDPLVTGTVRRSAATAGSARPLVAALDDLGIAVGRGRRRRTRYKGLVFDATGHHLLGPARRAPGVLHPAAAQPARPAPASSCSARPRSPRTPPRSASRSAPSRASPARSARRSAAAAPSSSCTSRPAADGALASTLAFLLSPKSAYVSGQVVRIGAARRDRGRRGGRGLDPAARRQGRARHRRQPRHRRADRPGAAPRRRHGPRHRRPAGRRASCRPSRASSTATT